MNQLYSTNIKNYVYSTIIRTVMAAAHEVYPNAVNICITHITSCLEQALE